LLVPPTADDKDALVPELQGFKAEPTKSRLETGIMRSSGVPTVTVNPPFSEAPHDASVDMCAALVATTSALSFISQNGYAKVHRKLKLTSFKTADEKNPIGDIVYRWESEFEASGQEMSVAVIVKEGMTTGYLLYNWAMGHRSRSMSSDGQLLINLKDPEDIMNGNAERFKHELQKFLFLHATELHFNHAKIRNCFMPRAW